MMNLCFLSDADSKGKNLLVGRRELLFVFYLWH